MYSLWFFKITLIMIFGQHSLKLNTMQLETPGGNHCCIMSYGPFWDDIHEGPFGMTFMKALLG